jgi:hypothetical protein
LGAALQADGENEVRGDGLKHQKEKRSMDHFGGLDVSVKETSICIVDDTGRIVKEAKVASEPAACSAAVEGFFARLTRRRLKRGVFRSLVLRHAKHHWQIPLRAEKSPRCDRMAMIRGFSRPILNS